MPIQSSVFLKAEWRKLIMANYAVDPVLLEPYLPAGTTLDLYNNTCYVSLVGFMFCNTKVMGIHFPFHTTFEEVNLRFYAKHHEAGEWKHGVAFIKELVPKYMVSAVAKGFFSEPYETRPMKHEWKNNGGQLDISYSWKKQGHHHLRVSADSKGVELESGSEAEFITERAWGYTKVNASKTNIYLVEHPRWKTYPVKNYVVDVDFEKVYGKPFGFLNHQQPVSVMLAEGSEITVRRAKLLK